MRLIDADTVAEAINDEIEIAAEMGTHEANVCKGGLMMALAYVNTAPAVDAAPVKHEEDGTLWVTVGDCEKVGRVIAKNEQGHFCRVFYMGDGDEEPVRHGHWIEGAMCIECSRCGEKFSDEIVYMCRPHRKPKRCPECGARMDGGK